MGRVLEQHHPPLARLAVLANRLVDHASMRPYSFSRLGAAWLIG
jgi:hypothetical protein